MLTLEPLVLTPQTVVARWASSALVVHASGHEGGVSNVGIERLPDQWPPEFQVVGRMSPFAGLFPYGITCTFELSDRPEQIVIMTKEGPQQVPVT